MHAQLQARGLLERVDRASLVDYCEAWGRHVEAELRISELDAEHQALLTARGTAPSARTRAELPGHVSSAASGFQQMSVWLDISERALNECARFLAQLGVSLARPTLRGVKGSRQPAPPGSASTRETDGNGDHQ